MKQTIQPDRAREIGLSVVLAIQGMIIFAVGPLAATGVLPPLVTDVFRVGLAAAAVILLTRARIISLVIVLTFLVSAALAVVIKQAGAEMALSLERIAATTAFDIALGVAVARIAFGEGRVSIHRIMGAVILYLSIGLVFCNAYRAATLLLHPSFNGLAAEGRAAFGEMLYFSLTTLTTTGYGDITPVHPFVRSLANLEAVIGQLFPATLLARLVTLHATPKTAESAPPWSSE